MLFNPHQNNILRNFPLCITKFTITIQEAKKGLIILTLLKILLKISIIIDTHFLKSILIKISINYANSKFFY